MSRGSRIRLTLFLTAMAWLMVVAPASAYVDGGSLSMIFQVLVAGAAALGTALVVFWQRITSFFRRDRGEAETPPTETPTDASERV